MSVYPVKKVNGPHIQIGGDDVESTNVTVPPFLASLWQMVNLGECIHWASDGESFVIDSTEEFEEKILPAYFKHNKLSSFVRQLNMYKFAKIGHSSVAQWSHKLFLRGHAHLLSEIRRKTYEPKTEENALPQPVPITFQSKSFPAASSASVALPPSAYLTLQDQLASLMETQRIQQQRISELESRRELIQKELVEGKNVQEAMQQQLQDSVKNVTSLLAVLLAKHGSHESSMLSPSGMNLGSSQGSSFPPPLTLYSEITENSLFSSALSRGTSINTNEPQLQKRKFNS